MRCCWCGGEILEPVKYQAPARRTAYMEIVRVEMKEKLFCTPVCMQRHLAGFSRNLTHQPRGNAVFLPQE